LKVFKEHLDWWEEFRLYHRKEGKVVKEGDDLLCATRYALMMLHHASTQSFSDRWRKPIEYSKMPNKVKTVNFATQLGQPRPLSGQSGHERDFADVRL
jgi:hypothetical protein